MSGGYPMNFVLDCLWILSQCVIGFAIIMLLIIGASTLKMTLREAKRKMDERAQKWKN